MNQLIVIFTFILTLFTSSLCHLNGQPNQNETLIYQDIAPDNPDRAILEAWLGHMKQSYKEGGMIKAEFNPWRAFSGPTLEALLPSHRFYVTFWLGTPTRKGRGKVNSQVFIAVLASVDQRSRSLRIYEENGNYEPFGDLLREGRITIDSQAQAERVWEAFCELHRKAWRDQPSRRISDREWWLGETIIDQIRYAYRVSLEDDGRVFSGSLFHERISSDR